MLAGLFMTMGFALAQPAAGGTLAIDVMDARAEVARPMDEQLLFRLRSHGQHEWEAEVVERANAAGPNLLYHSAQWHGPYPTQVFAWHVAARQFPDERWLCVRGHPYEVAIRLKDLAASGAGNDARFTGGRIEVEWQKRACTRGFGY